MSDEGYYFKQFSKLPSDLVSTAIEVTKFTAHFVVLKEPKSFQWQKFLDDGINKYPGGDLSMDKFQSNTIAQQTVSVKDMASKIVGFLKVALSIDLVQKDVDALVKEVEATFTGLKVAKANGWADFTKYYSGNNSSWQYRVQFAFPNPDLPDYFYSLVTTIRLQADIVEESSWWGLQSSSRHNFSASIDAMELIVMKGFKDPLKPA